jgi:hypothetical protein
MPPRAVPPWAAMYTYACIRWLLCMQLPSLKSATIPLDPNGIYSLEDCPAEVDVTMSNCASKFGLLMAN